MTTRTRKPTTSQTPESPPIESTPTPTEPKGVHHRLAGVQERLNVPKNRRNTFGNYNYRSAEDILKAAKDICIEWGLLLTVTDEIVPFMTPNPPVVHARKDHKGKDVYDVVGGDRFYIKATATVTDIETCEQVSTTGWAREADFKSGMDESQLTGATSSYARKYALNGLFAIDDDKDADTNEYQITKDAAPAPQPPTPPVPTPERQKAMAALHAQGTELGWTHEELSELAKRTYQVTSMTKLTETQIKDLTDIVKTGTQPGPDTNPTPDPTRITTWSAFWATMRQNGVPDKRALEAIIGPYDQQSPQELMTMYQTAINTQ